MQERKGRFTEKLFFVTIRNGFGIESGENAFCHCRYNGMNVLQEKRAV